MTPALPSLGLNLAGLHPQDKVLLAREAEEAGFHYVTVGDNIDDAFVSLASIASTTTRIRLVSSVATWTRTPVTTARACRNLDLLSDGRFILGLGSMPRRWNEEFHGDTGKGRALPHAGVREPCPHPLERFAPRSRSATWAGSTGYRVTVLPCLRPSGPCPYSSGRPASGLSGRPARGPKASFSTAPTPSHGSRSGRCPPSRKEPSRRAGRQAT